MMEVLSWGSRPRPRLRQCWKSLVLFNRQIDVLGIRRLGLLLGRSITADRPINIVGRSRDRGAESLLFRNGCCDW